MLGIFDLKTVYLRTRACDPRIYEDKDEKEDGKGGRRRPSAHQ